MTSLDLTTRAILFLMVLTISSPVSAQRQRTARSGSRSVNASQFPGADLGAKINAADRALGTGAGEIVVRGGGMISTQVIISSDHTLRLLSGTYVTNTTLAPILLKPRSSIVGSGWDAILMESTAPNQFTVISAYNNAQRNGSADNDLLIRDVQVKGANPGFHSAPQAISLGNCSNCTVDRVWINGTRSIGIQLGGSAREGHFADNSKVTNCLFTRVASQNLALVNGRNILFEGNKLMATGQQGGPGSTSIDLEPNGPDDRLENVIIRNNVIDHRGSAISPTGNGIVIQATTGTRSVGNILVERNTIIGGSNTGVISSYLSNGIYIFGPTMRGVTVRDNTITRTGQAGINLEGSELTVINNKLVDVGGGGTPGFIIRSVRRSRITGNTLNYSGQGPNDGRMLVTGDSTDNVIQGNNGFHVTRS